ncbi:MAG: hypothetical protein RL336_1181, partial [Pseudomonadota bacterium]
HQAEAQRQHRDEPARAGLQHEAGDESSWSEGNLGCDLTGSLALGKLDTYSPADSEFLHGLGQELPIASQRPQVDSQVSHLGSATGGRFT